MAYIKYGVEFVSSRMVCVSVTLLHTNNALRHLGDSLEHRKFFMWSLWRQSGIVDGKGTKCRIPNRGGLPRACTNHTSRNGDEQRARVARLGKRCDQYGVV